MFKLRGEVFESLERFFLLRTNAFDPQSVRFEAIEEAFFREYRWWSLKEIWEASHTATFVPRRMAELLTPILGCRIPTLPVETGP